MRIGNHTNPHGAQFAHGTATGGTPSASCTVFHSKVKGSGDRFGSAANSAFNRSARALLIGCVESHDGNKGIHAMVARSVIE